MCIRDRFLTMPKWFSVLYWSNAMKGKTGTLAIAPHANSARSEMQLSVSYTHLRAHETVLDLVCRLLLEKKKSKKKKKNTHHLS